MRALNVRPSQKRSPGRGVDTTQKAGRVSACNCQYTHLLSQRSKVKRVYPWRSASFGVQRANVSQGSLYVGVAQVLLNGNEVNTGLIQPPCVGPSRVV